MSSDKGGDEIMTTQVAKKPVHILIGEFRHEHALRSAQAALQEHGIGTDFMGSIIKDSREGGEGSDGCYLLSVLVPRGREGEIGVIMHKAGANRIAEPARLGPDLKHIPHPGIVEDRELKLPAGREYPASAWPPAFSSYRVRPRLLDERDRIWSFDEVELGYSVHEALAEASRCLRCPDPPCVRGCPAHNDIPTFIRTIRDGDFHLGISVLRRTTNFPGVCGRVCDKARQCEGPCTLAREGGEPVAIGMLERFLADWELKEGWREGSLASTPRTGKKVAVVGSGPSGLAVACDLALRGHAVTVFEALPVAGGALAWGIPAFRLPPTVTKAEIEYLTNLGINFRLGVKVGVDITIESLLDEYNAVFVGAGAVVPTTLGIPGEELNGIYTATEFLSRAKLSRSYGVSDYQSPVIGERLVVIGGGNTAMDVAQTALRLNYSAARQAQEQEHTTMDVAETALRLGFREVTIVYRRSEAEMPARREELEGAKEEGTRFKFLTAPIRFVGDDRGRVVAMECIEMELGKPDSRGRREAVPKIGTEFTLQVDTVILALGYKPEPMLAHTLGSPEAGKTGLITIDKKTGRTNRSGVWAGGDIVTGADTVVRAMVAGKRAAQDIHKHLRGLPD